MLAYRIEHIEERKGPHHGPQPNPNDWWERPRCVTFMPSADEDVAGFRPGVDVCACEREPVFTFNEAQELATAGYVVVLYHLTSLSEVKRGCSGHQITFHAGKAAPVDVWGPLEWLQRKTLDNPSSGAIF